MCVDAKFFALTFECNSSGNLIAMKKHLHESVPFGTHFIAEWAEAMQIKFLARRHNILMQPGLEPSFYVSRNKDLAHLRNVLLCVHGFDNST